MKMNDDYMKKMKDMKDTSEMHQSADMRSEPEDKKEMGSMDNMDMGNMGGGDMMMHGGHMMHMGNLKQKFWVSLILTIPIIIMSPMMGMKLPFQITFPGSDWVVAILGTILFFYGGKPFFSGAKGELEERKPAMMTLISMGISVAYVYSVYAVIANNVFHVKPMVNSFFWELSTLIVIMLLGHWIEMNTVMNAGSAVDKLASLLPDKAHLVDENNQTTDVSVKDLKEGQMVQVRAGEQIPADGTIIAGSTSINESMVTGESKAVAKNNGDEVIGGTINGSGTFTFKISGTGESGYLSKVMKLVQNAQQNKSKSETMADKVAGYLFYAALIVGVGSFFGWLITRDLAFALSIAVTVFVVACPHALGLAVPLVTARSTAIAASNGLLVSNRAAIEKIKTLKYVLMDKTGTLTQGKFSVSDFQSFDKSYSNDQILGILASLENQSTHPLATGILAAAKKKKIQPKEAGNVSQQTGVGLSGTVDGQKYQVVSLGYVQKNQITYDESPLKGLLNQGDTVSFLLHDGKAIGFVAQGDKIKPEAKKMVKEFNRLNIVPVMLTGDNKDAAKVVADELGIKEFQAELLPEDKEKIVHQYLQKGTVMFVGDGVNDAPSLASADIGVAIGSGTDVAIDSADVVLVNSNPNDITKLIKLAKETNRKMTENLWWGAGYNIIAIPLAAGILAPIGFVLSPMVGAIVMSMSTIFVAINAMTIKEI